MTFILKRCMALGAIYGIRMIFTALFYYTQHGLVNNGIHLYPCLLIIRKLETYLHQTASNILFNTILLLKSETLLFKKF